MGIKKYQDLAYLLKCKSIKNDNDAYEKILNVVPFPVI